MSREKVRNNNKREDQLTAAGLTEINGGRGVREPKGPPEREWQRT
jgi:hypothetical protein